VGQFTDVSVVRHGLNSFYNSATIRFQRNLSGGLYIVSHYTFSKTVQDAPYYQPETYGFTTVTWPWNRKLGRGEAAFSHPHRFVFAGRYQSSWGANLPALARGIVHGWGLNVMTTFESGNALNVLNTMTTARDYEPNLPNVLRNPNLSGSDRTFYRYFDVSAFVAPPQDVKGNAGVGIIRGPGMNNWDCSVSKVFKIRESGKVEVRGEFFNVFNHTQWSSVNTNFDTSQASTFATPSGVPSRESTTTLLKSRINFAR
jgi:hypothetical protein